MDCKPEAATTRKAEGKKSKYWWWKKEQIGKDSLKTQTLKREGGREGWFQAGEQLK